MLLFVKFPCNSYLYNEFTDEYNILIKRLPSKYCKEFAEYFDRCAYDFTENIIYYWVDYVEIYKKVILATYSKDPRIHKSLLRYSPVGEIRQTLNNNPHFRVK